MKDNEEAVFLTVQAGAGGSDAEEWTAMLARMYARWCEREGWSAQLVDEARGAGDGCRRAVLRIAGAGATTRLEAEAGVHRLVRRRRSGRREKRQTAFAAVSTAPVPTDRQMPRLADGDVRIDTFGSSGPGGQHANRSESAVRATHLPTGLQASAQGSRSQHANRRAALEVLGARIAAAAAAADAPGRGTPAAFGDHRRSYTLYPYRQVRDALSGRRTAAVERVLDGEVGLVNNA